MTLVQKISSVFAFRTLPTTVLASLIYLAIFISVLVTDDLPAVPKNRKGLDLDQAYSDLHKVIIYFLLLLDGISHCLRLQNNHIRTILMQTTRSGHIFWDVFTT